METGKVIRFYNKKELRRDILQKREALSAGERETFSTMIREKIQSWCGYQGCEYLLCFVSFGSEVDTHGLIDKALQDGKKVYCPKVIGENMFFYKISSMDDLFPGYLGILEPREGLECFADFNGKVLLLMPGSVFDKKRNRIGYGKGFYDRFLAEYENKMWKLTTAALAFSLQVVEKVPVEKHDYRPEYLFTEKGIFGAEKE